MWNEASLDLQQDGELQIVGILQEQHFHRARLFMQWKRMDWPVMVDAANLLGVTAVPITMLIDEYGVIRVLQPTMANFREFMRQDYSKPERAALSENPLPDLMMLEQEALEGSQGGFVALGDAIFLWEDTSGLSRAIEAYERALEIDQESPAIHFRLGVTYRKRYDSVQRQEDDFLNAVEHWANALELDPNQYIYRRRIQQYGPRLDKPYSFYDWVQTARTEIRKRGEIPVSLLVEPGAAELAYPSGRFAKSNLLREEPDRQGKISRDNGRLIQIESIMVPPTVTPGSPTRIHVSFHPDRTFDAHWNNEVDELALWIDPPDECEVENRYHTIPNPPQATSKELREVEFEVKCVENAQPGTYSIPGYSLYYVCEGANGVCLYRRQDFEFEIKVQQ